MPIFNDAMWKVKVVSIYNEEKETIVDFQWCDVESESGVIYNVDERWKLEIM